MLSLLQGELISYTINIKKMYMVHYVNSLIVGYDNLFLWFIYFRTGIIRSISARTTLQVVEQAALGWWLSASV